MLLALPFGLTSRRLSGSSSSSSPPAAPTPTSRSTPSTCGRSCPATRGTPSPTAACGSATSRSVPSSAGQGRPSSAPSRPSSSGRRCSSPDRGGAGRGLAAARPADAAGGARGPVAGVLRAADPRPRALRVPVLRGRVILAAISWRWRPIYAALSVGLLANMYVVLVVLIRDNPQSATGWGSGRSSSRRRRSRPWRSCSRPSSSGRCSSCAGAPTHGSRRISRRRPNVRRP